jgi:hypothetical protein
VGPEATLRKRRLERSVDLMFSIDLLVCRRLVMETVRARAVNETTNNLPHTRANLPHESTAQPIDPRKFGG